MLEKYKEHLQNKFPFLENSKLLIAISGGIDSVVLSYLMKELSYDFSLCHCNFKLRGEESDDDEVFVKELAKKLNVELFTTSFDTQSFADENKLSIQISARKLRYKWFYELIEQKGYHFVLTAHNTNDNLETFIINLTRGTGLEGLNGIPPINNKSVRPLLNFTRDEIMMYAIKNGIEWREDRSNANVKYIRNKVRHNIVPILQEINPHMMESFQNTISYLRGSQQIIDDRIEDISTKILTRTEDGIHINIQKLKKLSKQRDYLYQLLHEYGFKEWDDVVDLLDAQPGKQIFSSTHRLLKDRKDIILTAINKDVLASEPIKIPIDATEIKEPITLTFQSTELSAGTNANSIVVDKDLLKLPLYVRKWSYGDYICPVGMEGSKKVSQLFKDRKLSLIEKEKIWMLTNANDEIIWVIGMRQDRRFAPTEISLNKTLISFQK